ncbi:MAG TPA: plastocyanin/azurin family copper-binding protein [Solirubrobacteraceae bacterium]|nr:plastocyanin/azurin family copper-binding protein [Solirubrobacteraceae bacterium]
MSTGSNRARRRLLGAASPALLALAVAGLAGCGGSSSSSTTTGTPAAAASTPTTSSAPASSNAATTSGTGSKLSLEANPQGQLKYNTTALSAKAGAVTIDFTNKSELAHNVTVESSSGSIVGAIPTFSGSTKSLSLNLKPGTYKFFCSVPGHRMAGMEGTLTVQ